jgi:hypothetical protein
MFLDFIKDFFIKKTLKKSLSNVNNSFSSEKIQSIGILIDESAFDRTEALLQKINENTIVKNNISLLIYKDKIKKEEVIKYPFLSWKDVSWMGSIDKPEVKQFMAHKFDMLISYYDVEKAPLMIITQQSKASFKVGFSTIDKRLNHFMIDTNIEKQEVFTNELFRYLKILNKI